MKVVLALLVTVSILVGPIAGLAQTPAGGASSRPPRAAPDPMAPGGTGVGVAPGAPVDPRAGVVVVDPGRGQVRSGTVDYPAAFPRIDPRGSTPLLDPWCRGYYAPTGGSPCR
jgi:hypothetical protein